MYGYFNSNDPKTQSAIVAFIDILGFKEHMKSAYENGKHKELLVRYRDALNMGLKYIKPIPTSTQKNQEWFIKAFTDNILLGYPYKCSASHEFFQCCQMLAGFQGSMAMRGFFIRGAIAIGDIYVDNEIVYGNGLIEAAEAEKNLARDPRIVLADTARQHMEDHVTKYTSPDLSPEYDDILKDADGKYFINYLYFGCLIDSDILDDSMIKQGNFREDPCNTVLQHKSIVENALDAYASRPRIWNKYEWVANYHNKFCDMYRSSLDIIDSAHKIDMNQMQRAISRIS